MVGSYYWFSQSLYIQISLKSNETVLLHETKVKTMEVCMKDELELISQLFYHLLVCPLTCKTAARNTM